MSDTDFIYVVYIRATRRAVWDALTDGETTAAFWFGRTNESSWRVGDTVTFRAPGGVIDFTGQIYEADPPRRLSHGFLHPTPGPMHDEGNSVVTYDLAEAGDGVVRLTVTHTGFPVPSVVRPGIGRGWPVILSGLKSLLETGRALPDQLDFDHVADHQSA